MTKAANTRNYILENAFSLIYKNGFQATSIDNILESTHVTKGAFYYHFKNKEEMGVALITDMVLPEIKKTLIVPLQEFNNPLNAIYQTIKTHILSLSDKQMKFGCPATNLITELPPISETYKVALQQIIQEWQKELVHNLQQAVQKQIIASTHNQYDVANFIITSYQGARTSGKMYPTKDFFNRYLNQLEKYLHTL